MSFYNGKKVLSVVRSGFKGGSLTLSAHGRYIPQDYGLEGFTDVINEAPETPTDVLKYIEGDNSVQYLAFGDDLLKIAGCFQCFPNLKKIYIQNTTEVLDIVSNAWDGTKVVSEGEIIVPNTLLSSYQTRYPNWNFSSWQYQTEFTIPFIGETTLTAEYIQNVVNMTGGYINVVNKVIVPIEFTSYENGAINKIKELFTSMTTLTTTYEAGVINLDVQIIITKLTQLGTTLDAELSSARTYSYSRNGIAERGGVNRCIIPPMNGTNVEPIFNSSYARGSNVVYQGNVKFGLNASVNYVLLDCPNAVYVEMSFTNYNATIVSGYMPNNASLKHLILNNYQNSLNISLSNAFEREGLVELINSLGTPSTTQTLNIGATNIAKLQQTDIDILINKNWTLA